MTLGLRPSGLFDLSPAAGYGMGTGRAVRLARWVITRSLMETQLPPVADRRRSIVMGTVYLRSVVAVSCGKFVDELLNTANQLVKSGCILNLFGFRDT